MVKLRQSTNFVQVDVYHYCNSKTLTQPSLATSPACTGTDFDLPLLNQIL